MLFGFHKVVKWHNRHFVLCMNLTPLDYITDPLVLDNKVNRGSTFFGGYCAEKENVIICQLSTSTKQMCSFHAPKIYYSTLVNFDTQSKKG